MHAGARDTNLILSDIPTPDLNDLPPEVYREFGPPVHNVALTDHSYRNHSLLIESAFEEVASEFGTV